MSLIRPVFRLGLGGRLGSGSQWMSCIEVNDLAAMVVRCLHDESISGAVNAVMPEPVTNEEFTRAVARSVNRPALFPVPAFALRLVLGDLSHLLLDSQRVVPSYMKSIGFEWKRPDLNLSIQERILATL